MLLRINLLLLALLLACGFLQSVEIPTNYQVSTTSDSVQNEEQIVVNPTDSTKLVAAWRDFRLGYRQVGIGRSSDGGDTWTDFLIPQDQQNFAYQSDPALTVDGDGNFYLAVLDFGGADSSYLSVYKSSDNGATWSGPVTVEDTLGPYFEDKEFIIADNSGGTYDGNVYIAWTRMSATEPFILFSRSTDGAATFDSIITVGGFYSYQTNSGETDSVAAGLFVQPLVASNGDVYVFWNGLNYNSIGDELNFAMKVVTSTNGGQSFSTPESLFRVTGDIPLPGYGSNELKGFSAPTSAADLSGGTYDGNIYLCYANNSEYPTSASGDWNIHFTRSTDNGSTWESHLMINDGDNRGAFAPYHQHHPWLYCGDNGILSVIYYDERTDTVAAYLHKLFDAFAVYSFDGGRTFTSSHRISDHSINADSMGVPNKAATKLAEYIGITAAGNHVNAVWTDTRNQNQDVYGANWEIPRLDPIVMVPNYSHSGGKGNAASSDTLFWTGYDLFESGISYRIQVDNDSAFSSVNYSDSISDNYVQMSTLSLSDGLYYARVKTYWSDNDSTEWSTFRPFELDTGTPNSITNLKPNDGDTLALDEILFDWEYTTKSRASDEFFTFQISDDPTYASGNRFYAIDTITSLSYSLSLPLGHDTTYYWRVNHYDLAGNETGFSSNAYFHHFAGVLCGDANDDGDVNVGDAVFLQNYVFQYGPAPTYAYAADVNSDYDVNVGDVVYIINFVFNNGAAPDCPYDQ